MEEKEEKFESNSARRLRMLGADEKENIHIEEDKQVKGKFLPNLWYRHKWAIILGGIFIVMMAIIIVQLSTKDSYDVKLMYTGPQYIPSNLGSLVAPFESLTEDYNEDGEKKVLLANITYQNEEQRRQGLDVYNTVQNAEANADALNQFEFQLMSSETPIYLLDKALFEDKNINSAFVPISQILGYTPQSNLMCSENGIYFKKTAFAKFFDAYSIIPDDTIICMSVKTTASDEEEYEHAIDFFKKIIEFK